MLWFPSKIFLLATSGVGFKSMVCFEGIGRDKQTVSFIYTTYCVFAYWILPWSCSLLVPQISACLSLTYLSQLSFFVIHVLLAVTDYYLRWNITTEKEQAILRKALKKPGNIVSLPFPVADCGFGEDLNSTWRCLKWFFLAWDGGVEREVGVSMCEPETM